MNLVNAPVGRGLVFKRVPHRIETHNQECTRHHAEFLSVYSVGLALRFEAGLLGVFRTLLVWGFRLPWSGPRILARPR